ncbi:rod-binding protein [Opitutus sp. ER46]|uniref:rod-binding protein n=1 Tax=Opitutus sp. ER46 TaxID=2161864 RepID=UPI000D325B8A|nr:rod-binding protein [Opitutus sp. ER46]PTX90925.1 hypothetical protein DB354_19940 [Opitutus sp. ER46]
MNVSGITSSTSPRPADETGELTATERVRAKQLRGSALRNAAPAEQRAAVAAQFEAVLVRQMLGKTMTSMLGNAGGSASSVYGDLLTDTMAQKLTSGAGMGLAAVIEKQLTPRISNPAATPSAT